MNGEIGIMQKTDITGQSDLSDKIQLALCDDNVTTMKNLEHFIKSYFDEQHTEYVIHQFLTPSDVFKYMNKAKIHILFMDLEFGKEKEDGMLWTKKIIDSFPGTLVLILTAYENRYKEGYRAKAFRFMTKPLILQEFRENLDDCLDELGRTHMLQIKQNHVVVSLAVKDIVYIEAFIGGSSIHTHSGKIYYSENSLLYFEQQLAKDSFFRIHKSYLIHLTHVTDIFTGKHEVMLSKSIRLPVSRRKWTDFQSSYIRFDVSQNREG